MERTHHVKNESKITLVSAKHVWTNDKYIFSSISIQTLIFNRVFFFFLWETRVGCLMVWEGQTVSDHVSLPHLFFFFILF